MLLGRLEEGLAGMREDMAEVKLEVQRDRVDASESRRRVYEKLEGAELRLEQVDSTVRVLGGVVEKQTNRIDALEPTVRKTAKNVAQWNWRWGLVVAGVTFIGTGIWWLIRPNAGAIWTFIQTLFH